MQNYHQSNFNLFNIYIIFIIIFPSTNIVSEATLFRRNCMITKLLTVYARKVGLKYLQNTLKPVIGLIPGYNLEDYEIVFLFDTIFNNDNIFIKN